MAQLRVKSTYTCSSCCSGGITLLRSSEVRRTFFQSTSAIDDGVAAVTGLASGLVIVVHEALGHSENLVSQTIAKLDSTCAKVASDGISTVTAVGVNGQVLEIVCKERNEKDVNGNVVTEWKLTPQATTCCMNENDLYVGFENGRICQLRSQCAVPIWESAKRVSIEDMLSRDRHTLITVGASGLMLYDTRSEGEPALKLSGTGLACVAYDKSTPNIVQAGTYDGSILEYDMRKIQFQQNNSFSHTGVIASLGFGGIISPALYSAGRDGVVQSLDGMRHSFDSPIRGISVVSNENYDVLGLAQENGMVRICVKTTSTSSISSLHNRPQMRLELPTRMNLE